MRTLTRSHFLRRSQALRGVWAMSVMLNAALLQPSLAQSPPAAPPVKTKTALEDLVSKRQKLAEQMKLLDKQATEAAGSDAQALAVAADELEHLEALDGVFGEQQVRLEQQQELLNEKLRAEAELASFRKFGPTEARPYSFLLLEDLRDELATEEDHNTAYAADLKLAGQMLEAAQSHFEQIEKARRRAQEQLAENKHDEREAPLTAAVKLAQRDSLLAQEMIVVRRLEVEVRSLQCDICELHKTELTEKVERIGEDVRFTKQDLQDRLKDLAAEEATLDARLKEVRDRFRQREQQHVAALNKLRETKAPQATIDIASDTWRVARDSHQIETSLLIERIGYLKQLHNFWGSRFATETGTATPTEIADWYDTVGVFVEELSDNRRSVEQRIASTRAEEAKLVQRLRTNDDPGVKQWGDFQAGQWRRLREACEAHLVQLNVHERWATRFVDELEERLEPHNADQWRAVAVRRFSEVWTYEAFTINDLPITVGKMVTLVVCLGLSLLAARVLSRLLGLRLLPRLGLNEGAAHAIQAIAFYSLASLFGVLSFQVVHIPLTAFAFLGGAVAIAVGFGSQDIANNFMSGIIILAEQPIRVGDIILVDGNPGTVEHIGPRSTRIKTEANHEIVVPNSKLLSDKVTNLTLSDTLIQTTVAVSLPPKLTIKEAKGLLLAAALSQPKVLHKPYPVVLLKQCSASAVDFELRFWLQLQGDMRAAIAQSEVREAINDLFQQFNTTPSVTTPQSSGGRASAA